MIVFIHGVADTHRIWNEVRSRIGPRDSIALALPGFDNFQPGFSSTKEAYVDWVIARLEEQDGPVDLVGHDWGCILAARVASLRPDLVRTWAGISGPVDGDYEWHDFAKIWQTPGEGERWMSELDAASFADQLVSFGVPEAEARSAVTFIDDPMKASILSLYRSAVEVGREWQPDLARVASPGLVIWGLDDPFLPHGFADSLAQDTRARAVVKLRAGHYPLLERPDDVARELLAHWG